MSHHPEAFSPDATDLASLVACPSCDALYRMPRIAAGEDAVCQRCHRVIAAPRHRAGMQIISLAAASLVLLAATLFFPFLKISAAGVHNATSVLDVVLAFTSDELAILVLFTTACILAIPALRMGLLLYVLVPLVFDHPPSARARPAFLLSERLKPWSMAEIFALGCAVALIKVRDLAEVEFGPAFWMFAGLVFLVLQVQRNLCSRSVWDALEAATPDAPPTAATQEHLT
ncbi:paraquat-inducible protein A [Tritonibacter horizontis]|uniref:Inner membrane protein YebS n=1 Tax=Tritonibacter horizontis TaxID=1768241 RepID=A0A132BY01_9RHOB|nr:paraquat-inducible protein A [Tritonibacter horizontis]KUP93279.1 inner membrane protein YebS [Tritonibacter horizontis]